MSRSPRAATVLSIVGLTLSSSCLAVPDRYGARDWPIEVLEPDPPRDGPPNPLLATRPSDEGYSLTLMVCALGMHYDSSEGLIESITKQDDGKPNDGVGHCWLVLDAPGWRIDGGHSGEYGKERPTYNEGVRDLMAAGDPNPARYLWEEMPDGVFLPGSAGMSPTYGCRVPLTREQHAAILRFIEEYDFRSFALRGKGCSDFVVAAARIAGLSLPSRVRLRLPPTISFLGSERRLWTDPEYGSIVFGSPEVLEAGLRELVASGAAEEMLLLATDEREGDAP